MQVLRAFTIISAGLLAGLLMQTGVSTANELYVAAGLSDKAGEPNYHTRRPTLTLAFEAQRAWRFSITSGDYEHRTKLVDLKTQVYGVERIWFYNMGGNTALMGSFGPGYFQAKVVSATTEASGTAFGILASGNLRVYLGKAYLDLGYHYRNAAVIINKSSFNGGYEALALGTGLRF